jgi:hypothetical protein
MGSKWYFIISLLFLLFATDCWAGFPATAVLDNFNRSNQTPPSSSWSGPAVGDITQISVIANTCGNSGGDEWNPMTVPGNNFEVYLSIPTLPGAGQFFDIWGLDTPLDPSAIFNGYVITVTPGAGPNQWVLSRQDAGFPTTLAQYTHAFNAGDSFGMRKIGTTITVWYESGAGAWTQIGSVTDTHPYNSLYLGMEFGDNTVRGDNFGGGVSAGGSAQLGKAKINNAMIN